MSKIYLLVQEGHYTDGGRYVDEVIYGIYDTALEAHKNGFILVKNGYDLIIREEEMNSFINLDFEPDMSKVDIEQLNRMQEMYKECLEKGLYFKSEKEVK